jgi:hypothetical protein
MIKTTLLTLSSFLFITLSGQASAQTNLLANPGFESSLTGWKKTGRTSASVVVTGHAKSGIYAARSGTAASGLIQSLVKKLVVGQTYRLTFWAKIGSNSVSSLVGIRVRNSNGGYLLYENLPILSTTYTQYTKDFTYGLGANSVDIVSVKEAGASSYLYVDDFSLTDLSGGGTTTGGTTTGGTTTGGTTTGGTTTGGTTTGGTTTGGTTTGGTTTGGTTTGGTTTGGTTTGGTTTGGTTTGGTTGGTPGPMSSVYKPLGVGGGGAMSGISISPYANLWFVGTDMGTLFRSIDLGQSWVPVNHLQAVFNSELTRAVSVGFSSDGTTVFHASAGVGPRRSLDAGITFQAMTGLKLNSGEYIRYWQSDSSNANKILAGTSIGLQISNDKGTTWTRVAGITEDAIGTFIDQDTANIYHATKSKISVSNNGGVSFTTHFIPSGMLIRKFAGGRDAYGLTLSFVDNDGANACSWVNVYLAEWGANSIADTKANCGYVWVNADGISYKRTTQYAGDHMKMAENDSSTIYTTGARAWVKQYGTKVHVSRDKGETWTLKLNQINYDTNPFSPWPLSKLEYSAVALDVGWWDNGYESFEINKRNSAQVAGSGYFFMFSTFNYGDFWKAPFTEYADTGTPTAKKKWKTRGLEVISAYKAKFHPTNSNLLYVASADIGGLCSDDHGTSFRVCKAQYNSNYDYSFDLNNDQVVYAASGNLHDYPNEWRANAQTNEGGIYKSINRGLNWTRLTPTAAPFNRQYLSVGYDTKNNILYAGSHENGISRSTNGGTSWALFNTGLPAGNLIIPQIEVDPRNGNAYALVTGNAPDFTNYTKTGVYFLDVANGSTTWTILRGTVNYPPTADAGYQLWYYPTSFAINFSTATSANTIYMTDYENHGNWLMSGVWKTSNNGQTWDRVKQVTHATQVAIDPHNVNNVYAAGYFQLDGQWGTGGQLFSKDGGSTWFKNNAPNLQQNARGVTVDPTDPSKIIYTYFGGGMLSGSNPAFY